MAQYAVAFDLDTNAMKKDGLNESQITKIYQTEIPNALNDCGFSVHLQGSVYHTNVKSTDEKGAIIAIMKLQSTLKEKAKKFCKYAKCIHVFRMDEWSDVTEIITGHSSSMVTAEEELEQAKLINDNYILSQHPKSKAL